VSRLHQLSTPKHRKNVSGAISFAQFFQNSSSPQTMKPTPSANKNSSASGLPKQTNSDVCVVLQQKTSSSITKSVNYIPVDKNSGSNPRSLWKTPECFRKQDPPSADTQTTGIEAGGPPRQQVQQSTTKNNYPKRDSFSAARSSAIRDMIKNFGSEATKPSVSSSSPEPPPSGTPNPPVSITPARVNDLAIPKYKSAKVVSVATKEKEGVGDQPGSAPVSTAESTEVPDPEKTTKKLQHKTQSQKPLMGVAPKRDPAKSRSRLGVVEKLKARCTPIPSPSPTAADGGSDIETSPSQISPLQLFSSHQQLHLAGRQQSPGADSRSPAGGNSSRGRGKGKTSYRQQTKGKGITGTTEKLLESDVKSTAVTINRVAPGAVTPQQPPSQGKSSHVTSVSFSSAVAPSGGMSSRGAGERHADLKVHNSLPSQTPVMDGIDSSAKNPSMSTTAINSTSSLRSNPPSDTAESRSAGQHSDSRGDPSARQSSPHHQHAAQLVVTKSHSSSEEGPLSASLVTSPKVLIGSAAHSFNTSYQRSQPTADRSTSSKPLSAHEGQETNPLSAFLPQYLSVTETTRGHPSSQLSNSSHHSSTRIESEFPSLENRFQPSSSHSTPQSATDRSYPSERATAAPLLSLQSSSDPQPYSLAHSTKPSLLPGFSSSHSHEFVEPLTVKPRNNSPNYEPSPYGLHHPLAPWNHNRPSSSPTSSSGTLAHTMRQSATEPLLLSQTRGNANEAIGAVDGTTGAESVSECEGLDETQSAAAIQLRNAKRRFRQSSQIALTRKWPMRGSPLVKLPDDPKHATKSPRPVSASQTAPDTVSKASPPPEIATLGATTVAGTVIPLVKSKVELSPPPQPGKSCLKKSRQRVMTIAGVSMIRRVKFDQNIRVEYFEVEPTDESSESDTASGGDGSVADRVYHPIVPKVKINVKPSSGRHAHPPRNIEEALEQNRRERERLAGAADDSSSSSESSLDDTSQIINFSKERFTVSDLLAVNMR
jgi:hypothetical protein